MPPRTNDLLETTPLAETVSKPGASDPRLASAAPAASRPIASGNRASVSPPAHLRSDALSLDVPVKVHGSRVTDRPGSQPLTERFEEETSTMIIFPQGAVLRLAGDVSAGQMLVLTNLRSKQEAICRVVKVRTYSSAQAYVEVEFTNPQAGFWGVFFPKDSPAAARKAAAEAAKNPPPSRSELPPTVPKATPVPPAAMPEAATMPSGRAAGPLAPEPAIPPAPQPLSAPPLPAPAISPYARTQSRPGRASAYASDPLAAKSFGIADVHPATPRPNSRSGLAAPSESAKPKDRPPLPVEPIFARAESIEEFEPVGGGPAFAPGGLANSGVPARHNPFGTFGPLSAGLPGASVGSAYVPPARTGRRWLVAFAVLALAGVAAGAAYVGLVAQNPVRAAISGLLRPRTHAAQVSPASPPASVETALAPAVAASSPASQPAVPAPSERSPVSPRLAAESPANPAFAPSASSPAAPRASVSASVLPKKPAKAPGLKPAPAPLEIRRPSPAAPATSAPAASAPRSLPTPVVSHPRFNSGRAKTAAAASAPEIDVVSPGSSAPLSGALGSGGPALPPAPPSAPLRVGGDVKQPRLASSVLPIYPIGAKNSGIEGDVVLEVVISRTGSVKKARVISGPAILRQAALGAVRQWKYRPSQLDGQPIEVLMQVTVQFRL